MTPWPARHARLASGRTEPQPSPRSTPPWGPRPHKSCPWNILRPAQDAPVDQPPAMNLQGLW
eukprot:299173-Chlamydomonas_euryale.AAC.1